MVMPIRVELSLADLPELQRLARACLDRDGGLPMFVAEPMLSSRLLRERTLGFRLADGTLAAAAGVSLTADVATTTGMVHPAMRRQGIGGSLLRWVYEQAGNAAVVVETESCTSDADALYVRHGLVRVFAETVMRHDLVAVPDIALPQGVQVESATSVDKRDLFAAYRGSFADRPDFPDPDAKQWLADLDEEGAWRRDLSLLARDERAQPVGFVNVLGNWLDQVGVLPGWRGRRLGAFLVARSLQSLQAEGAAEMWLCVNINNPAEDLYQRLGFRAHGTRARYVRPQQPDQAPTDEASP